MKIHVKVWTDDGEILWEHDCDRSEAMAREYPVLTAYNALHEAADAIRTR